MVSPIFCHVGDFASCRHARVTTVFKTFHFITIAPVVLVSYPQDRDMGQDISTHRARITMFSRVLATYHT